MQFWFFHINLVEKISQMKNLHEEKKRELPLALYTRHHSALHYSSILGQPDKTLKTFSLHPASPRPLPRASSCSRSPACAPPPSYAGAPRSSGPCSGPEPLP